MERTRIEIYDTTLRDGAQQPGISFSLHDKLAIMERLDRIGVDYIELGWPGSNEKDDLVFKEANNISLQNAKIVAFGMTCAKGKKPEEDKSLKSLLDAKTELVTIVGKASRYQVENILGVTASENLRMIEQSCRFLIIQGCQVFFDAEHFFDGYSQDRDYALKCLEAAVTGGASRVILCDTNGGSLSWAIGSVVARVVENRRDVLIGIHAHNDGEMAVANSLAAVENGAYQVQGTINGYGERCGNANLCSVVPALRVKMGLDCFPDEGMAQLTEVARFTAEVANLPHNPLQPYVGKNAFMHKGGLHANAVLKDRNSYNHIDPEKVGNASSVVVSELSGKSNVMMKAKEFGVTLTQRQAKKVLAQVEALENHGFQLEGADASLKLIMLRTKRGYNSPFEVFYRSVGSEKFGKKSSSDSAIVKLRINNGKNDIVHHVADGNGPINALDKALRKALVPHFPNLEKTQLVDYKVRVLPGKKGTAKVVRVLIDFFDGQEEWTTVGCSTDLIEASTQALSDGLEYAILKAH